MYKDLPTSWVQRNPDRRAFHPQVPAYSVPHYIIRYSVLHLQLLLDVLSVGCHEVDSALDPGNSVVDKLSPVLVGTSRGQRRGGYLRLVALIETTPIMMKALAYRQR